MVNAYPEAARGERKGEKSRPEQTVPAHLWMSPAKHGAGRLKAKNWKK